jgi:short-subunit dehydrogenase
LSGIGKASALAFAREGANVVLAARSDHILNELAQECQDLFARTIEAFGDVGVWINNAGVGAIGEFTRTPLEAHEQVLRTNLLGPLYGAYAVLPWLIKKRRGIIINTNSVGAFVGMPFTVSYSASKFGLRGLTEALRYELKSFPEIFACELYAGFVDTPAPTHAANYLGKEVKPTKPLVDPEAMARALVALARKPRPSLHSALRTDLDGQATFLARS